MTQSIQDVLTQLAADHFVGRRRELELLTNALADKGPIVHFIHGIGGIGKTSLLSMLAEEAREQGIPVILLDCREIEPTKKGFLKALQRATGQDLSSLSEAGSRLCNLGDRVLLVLDSYEVFRLMDTWMRQSFIPVLTDNIRIVFASREPPVSAWQIKPGWNALFKSINLEPLDETDALELLTALGLSDNALKRINQYTKGNPLALKLAATAIIERPELKLEDINSQKIIPHLIQLYLEDVPDKRTRDAMEATSVVRRVTQSILAVLLPDHAPQDIFERLARLPFVSRGSDGLIVHEIVRQAIADNLHASDPSRYHEYRYLAYRQYRKELQAINPEDVWRYTADFLYMIEEPVIREAFFPSDSQPYAVESAEPDDHAAITRITRLHEVPEAAGFTTELLQRIPQSFRAVRDTDGNTEGYYIVFDPNTVPAADFCFDPVMKNWWKHLKQNPIPADQRVLFLRRWLGAENGELPSPIQAACWLDVKGDYIRMRSVLRRVYTTAIDAEVYGPVLHRLGFELMGDLETEIGSCHYQTAVLDFGPRLFLGWLDTHVRAALQVEENFLDFEAREIILDENRIGLTPLEFGVISYLSDHEGKAISRDSLLSHVWGHDYEGGSNVVDARVRDLRKKLGPHSASIETVTGVGYRFRYPGH